ncbi:MAG: hypothetical protein WBX38_12275 [Candidatus Sulfotelmatobacter sp.]
MERDRVIVLVVEDLPPLAFRRRDSEMALIADDVLQGSTEEIGVRGAEFEIGESELIVEFSRDCKRLAQLAKIALPLRRKF